MAPKKTQPELTRSQRLRKYRHAYELCIKRFESGNHDNGNNTRKLQPRKSARRSPKTQTRGRSHDLKKRRSLNPYQKFVQNETKKDKYRNLQARERMVAVSKAWKSRSRS